MIKDLTSVQDELFHVGYRSFAPLNLTADAELDGDTDAGSVSVLCGYNIRECPEWVGNSFSISGCGISEHHFHLTKLLSHEFHSREAVYDVVEEEEEEEGGGDCGKSGKLQEKQEEESAAAGARHTSLSEHQPRYV
jgi:hypothetical protein